MTERSARLGVWLLIAAVAVVVVVELVDSSAPQPPPAVQPATAAAETNRAPVAPSHIGRSQRARDRAAERLGYFPAAPSKAGVMTPQWQEFAAAVDRACAVTYNQAMSRQAQAEQLAQVRNLNDAATGAVLAQIWAEQGPQIMRTIESLGAPPQRARLFERWKANVMERSQLREQAGDASLAGDWRLRSDLYDQIDRLKLEADRMGQRFGLRICTSN